MREILFRGKRIANGEWWHGNLIIDNADINETKHYIQSQDLTIEKMCVNSETISQYTGLSDKNGKGIFEGDIVEYRDVIFSVEWSLKYCAYLVVSKFSGSKDLLTNYDNCDVIGNIHDNPGLLEVK